jgi:filamentous hemagglutinin family protein
MVIRIPQNSACWRRRRSMLMAGCRGGLTLIPLLMSPAMAQSEAVPAATALPTGGRFVAGQGSLQTEGSALTVQQEGQRAVIDWSSFNIGSGALVQFNNGSGATLNRVVGGELSRIMGQMRATGSVFLINPQGVVVGESGRVVAGGSIALSTLDPGNAGFMAGSTLVFRGQADTRITNLGNLSALGGDIFLIARQIDNSGRIEASNGTAALAAGNEVLLRDSNGDSRIFVQGPGTASGDISSDGQISAAQIEIRNAGGNIYALAGDNGGLIRATGTARQNGRVVLSASGDVSVDGTVSAGNEDGSGGTVTVAAGGSGPAQAGPAPAGPAPAVQPSTSLTTGTITQTGRIDVAAVVPGRSGGTATLTAGAITLGDSARLSADGQGSGGRLFVGGDEYGGRDPGRRRSDSTLPNATMVTVAAGALLSADGGLSGTGDGGSIIVWSDDLTRFAGRVSARGGMAGGNGGFAEVSGRRRLDFTGRADLGAPSGRAGGRTGTLLLDPYDLTISNGTTTSITTGAGSFTANADSSILAVSDLQTALASANVIVQTAAGGTQTGDITVANSISWSSGNSLTLIAHGSIFTGTSISIASTGSAAITLQAQASIRLNTGSSISTAGGNILLQSRYLDATTGWVDLKTATLTSNGGNITISGGSNTSTGYAIGNFANTFVPGVQLETTTINAGGGNILIRGTGADVGTVSYQRPGGIESVFGTSVTTSGSGSITLNGVSGSTGIGYGAGLTFIGDSQFFTTGSGGVNITGTSSTVLGTSYAFGFDDAQGGSTQIYSSGNGTVTLTAVSGAIKTRSGSADSTVYIGRTIGGTVYNSAIVIEGDSMDLSNGTFAVSTGASGSITVRPVTASHGIDLGSTGTSSTTALELSNTELNLFTVASGGALRIGAATSGAITVSAAVNISSANTVRLLTGSTISQTAALTVTNLAISATGATVLSNSGNSFATVASTGGSLTLLDSAGTLTIGAVDGLSGISTNGIVKVMAAGGALTLSNSVSASGTGDPLILAANGTFTNSAGTSALTAGGGGRWLVFSQSPLTSSNGGLTGTPLYNRSFDFTGQTGGTISNSGNRFVYTLAPTLTVTANNLSGTYGSTLTPAATITGLVGSDSLASAVSGSAAFSGAGTTVGSYTLTPTIGTLASDYGYQFGFTTGTLTVTAAPLTVTANAATTAYGTSPTLTAAYSGFVNSETSSALGGTLAFTGAGTNVGSYSITPTGLTAANYTISYAAGTLTVTPAPLTVTANAATTAYGTSPTLTAAYSGFVNSDTASALGGALSFSGAGTNAGSYSITPTGLTASNYTISYAAGTLTVTPAPLTVTANAANTVYGTAPTLTAAYSGFVNSETSSVLGGTLAFSGAGTNAGSYSVTPSGLTATNYTISYAAGTLTVTPAPLTVTANAANTVYGTAPTLTAAYSGFVNSETASILNGTLAFTGAGTNAGSYSITPTGLTAANYTISYAAGTLTVTPAPLTVTANAASTVYGTAPTLTAAYSGFVNSETASVLNGTLAFSGAGTNADSYSITSSGLTAANYTISYAAGTLTVTPAPLTVTANAASTVYGTAPILTAAYSGFVNSETASVLSGTLAFSGAGTNAGSYSVTPSGLTAANYTISYAAGTLTVTPAPLTVTTNAASTVYGTAPTLTAAYSGFVNSETASVLSGTLAFSGAGTNAGSYRVTPSGLTATNYTISYAAGTLTVTPAPLTVTANAATTAYGTSPTLTAAYSGFVNSETSAVLGGTLAFTGAGTNAGSYNVTPSGLTATNYTISYAAGTLTVTPAPLTVTANAASTVYGTAPTLTAAYSGFVNSETASVLNGTLAFTGAGTNAGSYRVTPSGLTAANYTISYAAGTLTVTPAPLTVTANAASTVYGTAPTLTAAYSGFVNSETASVLNGTLAFTGAGTNAGSYRVTPSGLTAANYTISYAAGTLTVTPAPLTVTANAANTVYGTAPTLTAAYSGFVNSETASVLSGTLAFSGAGTNAGSYRVTPSGLTATNYTISYAAGTLTVTPAPLTVTANAASTVYGTAPTLTAAYSGFVNSETASVLNGTLAFTGAGTNAGSYSITPTGLTAANYTISYAAGTLTVTPALIRWQFADQNTLYGTLPVPGQPTLSGVIAGDSVSAVLEVLSGGRPVSLTARSAAGLYSLTVTGLSGSAASNYRLAAADSRDGVLTIDRRPIRTELPDIAVAFGVLPPAATPVVEGLLEGDTVQPVVGLFDADGNEQAPGGSLESGSYVLRITGLEGSSVGNYRLDTAASRDGTITVSPRILILSSVSQNAGTLNSNPLSAGSALAAARPDDGPPSLPGALSTDGASVRPDAGGTQLTAAPADSRTASAIPARTESPQSPGSGSGLTRTPASGGDTGRSIPTQIAALNPAASTGDRPGAAPSATGGGPGGRDGAGPRIGGDAASSAPVGTSARPVTAAIAAANAGLAGGSVEAALAAVLPPGLGPGADRQGGVNSSLAAAIGVAMANGGGAESAGPLVQAMAAHQAAADTRSAPATPAQALGDAMAGGGGVGGGAGGGGGLVTALTTAGGPQLAAATLAAMAGGADAGTALQDAQRGAVLAAAQMADARVDTGPGAAAVSDLSRGGAGGGTGGSAGGGPGAVALAQALAAGLSPEQAAADAGRTAESLAQMTALASLPETAAQKTGTDLARGDGAALLTALGGQAGESDPALSQALSGALASGLSMDEAVAAARAGKAAEQQALTASAVPVTAADQETATLSTGTVSPDACLASLGCTDPGARARQIDSVRVTANPIAEALATGQIPAGLAALADDQVAAAQAVAVLERGGDMAAAAAALQEQEKLIAAQQAAAQVGGSSDMLGRLARGTMTAERFASVVAAGEMYVFAPVMLDRLARGAGLEPALQEAGDFVTAMRRQRETVTLLAGTPPVGLVSAAPVQLQTRP